MIGLTLSILLTVIIAICLFIWKMATTVGIPVTLLCIAGATAIMTFDYIRDHKK